MTESVQNALSGTDLTTKENPIEIAFANKKRKLVPHVARRSCGMQTLRACARFFNLSNRFAKSARYA